MVGDGRRMGGVGAGGGLQGTTRGMSHDFNLAGTRGPSARVIVPYSPSGPHISRRSQS